MDSPSISTLHFPSEPILFLKIDRALVEMGLIVINLDFIVSNHQSQWTNHTTHQNPPEMKNPLQAAN